MHENQVGQYQFNHQHHYIKKANGGLVCLTCGETAEAEIKIGDFTMTMHHPVDPSSPFGK